ncbi:hypothetical protein GE061_020068 [Apolygus lucorum]|uniref:Uncharacterized protein n=1 Tax=Apolygus lucorum TaxID=248454 RepID=A0A6A4K141_APOLU|nr:hypothetical protein GE061_020068 [Apolygus lucorum]
MNTLMRTQRIELPALFKIMVSVAQSLLFYNVPDVLGQPLPNPQKLLSPWGSPYPMLRHSQQSMQSAQYSSPQNYNGDHQPSFNQAPPQNQQQRKSSEGIDANTEYHSDFSEHDYPDSSTVVEEEDKVDDWKLFYEDRQHNTHHQEDAYAGETQMGPPMVRRQLFRQPEKWEEDGEEEEDEINPGSKGNASVFIMQMPKYDEVEIFGRAAPEDRIRYEIIPDRHEPVTTEPPHETTTPRETSAQFEPPGLAVRYSTQNKPSELLQSKISTQSKQYRTALNESSTGPPHVYSSPKDASRYEILEKTRPSVSNFQKPAVAPPQYKNYPEDHSDIRREYAHVLKRLHSHPEYLPDHYGVSDPSIRDSIVLPEAKAAARTHNT